ncbi:unnamed protein product, partial [Ectocarpus sp. 12 AP-2014]
RTSPSGKYSHVVLPYNTKEVVTHRTVVSRKEEVQCGTRFCVWATQQEEWRNFAMSSEDRAELVALFQSTGGTLWKHNAYWDTDAQLSQWYGVHVNRD